jgi:phage terminase small subunit
VGKRGPPLQPDDVKQLRGTARPDRMHPRTVPILRGGVTIPRWLTPLAAELWNERVAVYAERGMSIRGCESQLAHYCNYDAAMIALWESGETPSASMMQVLNKMAAQFYDTPAAQISQQAAGKQSAGIGSRWSMAARAQHERAAMLGESQGDRSGWLR